jgi:hypothetical protein
MAEITVTGGVLNQAYKDWKKLDPSDAGYAKALAKWKALDAQMKIQIAEAKAETEKAKSKKDKAKETVKTKIEQASLKSQIANLKIQQQKYTDEFGTPSLTLTQQIEDAEGKLTPSTKKDNSKPSDSAPKNGGAFNPQAGNPLNTTTPSTIVKSNVNKSSAGKKDKEKATDVDPKVAYTNALRETFKSLPKEYAGEINRLLEQAAKSKMKESVFMAELQKTQWWQSSLPSLQAYFIESHDPRNKGTFAEKIRNASDSVSRQLESLGIKTTQIDPVTGNFVDNTKVIQGLASLKLLNGWSDAQFTQHLAENAQVHFSSGGVIGSSLDTIKRQALAYGISIDKNYEKQIQFSLLDPTDGRDAQYYMNEMKNQAMDTYKPFAESIKQGRSMYEITSNYRTKMANLLETDSTNVTWQDLMGKVIDPKTGTARMESEFIKQVKKDPLWQYTKNAKETYSNTALDLMKQFGFIG